ncbi:MAG TPA: hypothetical protein VHN37_13485 [Actinomycetota bacterium]|nr:hypothetical protein [Actinomycetota bacterium]
MAAALPVVGAVPAAAQAPECETLVAQGPPAAHAAVGAGVSTYPQPQTGVCTDVLVGAGPVQVSGGAAAGAGDALDAKEVQAGAMVCFPTFCTLAGADVTEDWDGNFAAWAGVCYFDSVQAFCVPDLDPGGQ